MTFGQKAVLCLLVGIVLALLAQFGKGEFSKVLENSGAILAGLGILGCVYYASGIVISFG